MAGESSNSYDYFMGDEITDPLVAINPDGLNSLDGDFASTGNTSNNIALDNTITVCFLISSILNTTLHVIGFISLADKLKVSYRSIKISAIVFTLLAHLLLLSCAIIAARNYIKRNAGKKNSHRSPEKLVKIVGTSLVAMIVIFSSSLLLKSILLMKSPPNFLPILGCIADVLYITNVCAILHLEKTAAPESGYFTRGPLEKVETCMKLLGALLCIASICTFFITEYVALGKSDEKYMHFGEFAITFSWMCISITSIALSHLTKVTKCAYNEKLQQPMKEKSLNYLSQIFKDLKEDDNKSLKLRQHAINKLIQARERSRKESQSEKAIAKKEHATGALLRKKNGRRSLKWTASHYR
ncbi:hypothetical protein [Anaplasma bovis]|uniref:hypothetical protein n=1 Tax=Anaplasma bovis TaxID=186733 RepID=UPI002FF294A3